MSIVARRLQRASSGSSGTIVDETLYSIWPSNPTPQTVTETDNQAVEVGVVFFSSTAAQITAIRFYKGPQNTGTHSVSLWQISGTLIKTAVSTGETASGWQTVYFNTPVPILAGTSYVASYFAPVGHYSSSSNYFLTSGVTSGILSSPETSVTANGLYKYGFSSVFPDQSFSGTNYWVDVIAQTVVDSTAPGAPSNLTAVPLGRWASLSWTAATDDVGVESYLVFRDGVQVGASGTTEFTDTTTTASTAYTYTVQASDFSGNLGGLSNTASVTTGINAAPTASFTTSIVGRTIFASAMASSDTDGFIAQYDWVLGDGTTRTGTAVEYSYSTDGTYTIQLTVTDGQGATNSISHNVTVSGASFQSNLINNPSAGGYPDATNTGVPSGTVLTPAGNMTITEDGAVIENLLVNGTITIDASNVTIRNCHIICESFYPIINYASNLLVEDCEIEGTSAVTTSCIAFGSYTVRRCNMHGSADGTKSDSDVLIEDCFIHSLAVEADTHNDGTQTTGGSNVIIRHNTYRLGDQGGINACIQFGNEGGNNSNWLVEDNLFDGGGWTFNGSANPADNTNMSFLSNRFTKRYAYGVGGVGGSEWFGNYYDDDGSVA